MKQGKNTLPTSLINLASCPGDNVLSWQVLNDSIGKRVGASDGGTRGQEFKLPLCLPGERPGHVWLIGFPAMPDTCSLGKLPCPNAPSECENGENHNQVLNN